MKKQTLYTTIMWILSAVFILSLMLLINAKGVWITVLLITTIVSAVVGCVFSWLAQKEKAKSQINSLNSGINAQKEYLANTAFNQLLKRGEDYTVAAEVDGHILVKKIINWYYCDLDANGKVHALFTITTDKGEFAFQAENDQLLRVPLELVTSIYGKPKSSDKKDVSKTNKTFAEWLSEELDNVEGMTIKAFNINIYENANGYSSAELIASLEFDENNDDWATNEIYSSRADGEEFEFKAENFEEALVYIKKELAEYLKTGAQAQVLKKAEAVAFGFVDGDLEIVYRNKQK